MSLVQLPQVMRVEWLDHERAHVWLREIESNPRTLWTVHLSQRVLEVWPPPKPPKPLSEWERKKLEAEKRLEARLQETRRLWGTG